jgi:hypothetical protein
VSLSASLRAEGPREILEPNLSPVDIDWELNCLRDATRQALHYWQSLCGGRRMPRRSELRPAAMRSFISHVNLVDVVRSSPAAPDDYIVTLEGHHAHEIYGAVAHRRLDEILPPHLEQRWRNGFSLVRQVERPVRFSSTMNAGGRSWLAGESLMAPLGEEGRGVEALFVVLVTWSVQGRA